MQCIYDTRTSYLNFDYYMKQVSHFYNLSFSLLIGVVNFVVVIVLQNKIFIHRGQPYEKLSAFIKRLTDEYTAAEVSMLGECLGVWHI